MAQTWIDDIEALAKLVGYELPDLDDIES